MKLIVKLSLVFTVSFLLLNATPLIPIEYSSGEERLCTLNYISCLHSMYGDDFPSFLKSDLWILFLLPIFLPLLITYIFHRFVNQSIARDTTEPESESN